MKDNDAVGSAIVVFLDGPGLAAIDASSLDRRGGRDSRIRPEDQVRSRWFLRAEETR